MSLRPNDLGWVKTLFGLTARVRDQRLRGQRLYANSMASFADTTVGGNKAINAPPQFTRFADPVIGGFFANPKYRSAERQAKVFENSRNAGSYGLGGYYEESIEANSMYLHCRFGKPKYVGTVAFFATMYDSNLAHMARTGDYPGIARTLGAWTMAAALFFAVGAVAFTAIIVIPKVVKMLLNMQSSRYYTVKPTMHFYLRAVQSIINTQLIHYRLVPMIGAGKYDDTDSDANKYKAEKTKWHSLLPDIWKANGEFDIYKMINRYQILANYQATTLSQIYDSGKTPEGIEKEIEKFYVNARSTNLIRDAVQSREVSLQDLEKYHLALREYDAGFHSTEERDNALRLGGLAGQVEREHTQGEGALSDDPALNIDGPPEIDMSIPGTETPSLPGAPPPPEEEQRLFKTIGDMFSGMWDYMGNAGANFTEQVKSEMTDGGQWVTWRIDAKESVALSISNSTKEPEISSTINGVTSKIRSLDVNTSGGQTGIGLIDGATAALKNFVTSGAEALHLTGLAALYNSSVIDFPEVWDSASTDTGDVNLTIPLRSWSGSDLDVFQDIIIPVSFWLAAAIPLSTGKQSYIHPFYLECYCPGKFAIRNGIITSMSLTRGTGNMPWRPDGVALGVDLSITIKDLSRALHMPLVTDPLAWDDDSKFSDLMGTLGAQQLREKIYGVEKMLLNANHWAQSWKSAWSTGSRASYVGNLAPVRVLAGLFGGTTR